jgi:hypothetical protein
LVLSNVEHVDLSGLELLQELDKTTAKHGVTLLLAAPTGPVRDALAKMHAACNGVDSLQERTYSTIDAAVSLATLEDKNITTLESTNSTAQLLIAEPGPVGGAGALAIL